ncbi:MAG: hypothetical protein ACREIV_13700, partial [Planctomycetaceae bacterium]
MPAAAPLRLAVRFFATAFRAPLLAADLLVAAIKSVLDHAVNRTEHYTTEILPVKLCGAPRNLR